MRLALPCGCPTIVNFPSGERRVVCEGGGTSGGPVDWQVCPGGRGYVVAAEPVTAVTYKVRPLAVVVEVAS